MSAATRRGLGAAMCVAGLALAFGSAGAAVAADAPVACAPGTLAYVATTPAALTRLDSERAWTLATGAGVVVAVVDSGVDVGNAHLAGAVQPGTDIVAIAGDPAGTTDLTGHGTAIAGEIAARAVPTSGVIGLARDATILPVRVYYGDDDQAVAAGTAPRTDRIAAGIRYAVDHGATIINVSISSTVDDPNLREAVRIAAQRGALVVASAGNRRTADDTTDSPRYPAAYPGALAVTAVDDLDHVTDDSIHGAHVDVAAPGTNILTAFHAAGDCQLAGAEASTSFATAYVSAAAALIAERFPAETPAQWAYRLEVTASRLHSDASDDLAGWGVIRPYDALAFVDDGSAPGPPSPVYGAADPAQRAAQALTLRTSVDPLAPARSISAWWLIGGGAALVAALLGSRLTPRRRRASRLDTLRS